MFILLIMWNAVFTLFHILVTAHITFMVKKHGHCIDLDGKLLITHVK